MRVTVARRPSVWVLLIRFWITGKPLWGEGDNATFLRDATVDHRGGPVERLTRARWRRVGIRWTVLAGPMAAGCAFGRWGLVAYLAAAGTAGTAVGVRALVLWWPARDERREFVYPVWQITCKILGEKYSRRAAARAVQLFPGTEDTEYAVRLHLPVAPMDEGTQKRLVASVGPRLGIADPAASWTLKGARATVDIVPRLKPPAALTYRDVSQLVLDASASRPLAGLAAKREPVYVDLDNDGPHMGISGGTGSGKSTLLRLVLSRRMAAGVGVVCCDYKVISHPWLRRVAQDDPHRALYAMEPEEISEAILAVFAEFTRRREVLKQDASALETFREIDLVIEELNSTAALLRKWWGHERRRILAEAKANGEDVPYVPIVPEAVDASGVLVQAGRELRIHVHFLGQRLDASAIAPKDGGAVRESISNRFLAKYTKKAWQMLADGVPYLPFPGGPRGIWVSVQDGQATAFRVPFMSDSEAYQLAMSGPAPAGPVLGAARLIPDYEPRGKLVTLGEAWELLGAPSLDALRKAVQRAELAPAGRRGNALEYDVRALEGVLQKR